MKRLDNMLSPKQVEFFYEPDARINILSGSVRSGKTYISLLKFALRVVATKDKSATFLFVGKTLTTLERNCLSVLTELVGQKNFVYSMNRKEGALFGRKIYLEGAGDQTAEHKIRGMTLDGAYCDEATLYPENFFVVLLTRLSKANAKLYATCNPDSPTHWLKKKYIEREEDLSLKNYFFSLEDNKFLPEEYVDEVRKEFDGVFYNRFILGQWVRAEGIIYDKFANNPKSFYLPKDFNYNSIITLTFGVDFGGTKSGTTFVCTGFTRYFKDVIILEAERHEQELNPVELEDLFAKFINMCTTKYAKYGYTYADSAEQILIRGLKRIAEQKRLQTMVVNAKKMAVLDRIKLVQKLMGQGRFYVHEHCTTVIDALSDAVWNEKKEDERLDDFTSDIDTLDAMEYSIEPHFRELTDYVVRN